MTLQRFGLMLRNQTFFFKLGKVAKFYEGYCKKKVAMMKENEKKVKWSSKEAQILLHSNLCNSTLQEHVAFICNRHQAHELKILKGQQVWLWI